MRKMLEATGAAVEICPFRDLEFELLVSAPCRKARQKPDAEPKRASHMYVYGARSIEWVRK